MEPQLGNHGNQANHGHTREFRVVSQLSQLSLGLGKHRNQGNHGHTNRLKRLLRGLSGARTSPKPGQPRAQLANASEYCVDALAPGNGQHRPAVSEGGSGAAAVWRYLRPTPPCTLTPGHSCRRGSLTPASPPVACQDDPRGPQGGVSVVGI